MESYSVVGIMSGTSLDGVDLALCTFSRGNGKWNYKLEAAETVPYSKKWIDLLTSLPYSTAEALTFAHTEYGKYLGQLSKNFLDKNKRQADFIASHGHTIFHQPMRRFTFQLGDGAALSVACGLPVVCDFRTTDVALGGQGAPLVPVGDLLLFGDYEICLNLGGIANISSKSSAFDICPCNMILNLLAGEVGKKFDEEGRLAASGSVNNDLLKRLNALDYYLRTESSAKSLGREDIEQKFLPVIHSSSCSIEDKLATFCEHVSEQIANSMKSVAADNPSLINTPISVLVTGGGAFNNYLIERIQLYTQAHILIPERNIVEFKEAVIFGFLGVLRWIGEVNCLKRVTGAERDSIVGAIYSGR